MISSFPSDDGQGQSLVRCSKPDLMHFVKRKAKPLKLALEGVRIVGFIDGGDEPFLQLDKTLNLASVLALKYGWNVGSEIFVGQSGARGILTHCVIISCLKNLRHIFKRTHVRDLLTSGYIKIRTFS